MLAEPMAVIMLITVLLVAVLSAGSVRSWREGQAALGQLEQLRQILVLQEMLGLERGPTNGALTARPAVSPQLSAALAARRQASDQRLRELAALPGLSDHVGTILAQLSVRLTEMRASADMVIRQPPEQRSANSGTAVIGQMLALPPLLFPAVEQILAGISAADPAVTPLLTATRTASDLRLYGGSIISKFTGAMIKGERITVRDVGLIRIQQGQVIALHQLLLASINLANVGEQARGVVDAMELHYFGAGQQLIDGLIAGALDNGQFSMTPTQLLAAYEPSLDALVALRDRLFVLTHQAMEADQAARLHRLEATAAAGAAILLTVLAALLMLHRWIIRPLAELAAMIIRLAEGDRSVQFAARRGSREIVELASAIEVLRAATIEADASAARRRGELQRWTAQLRQVLDTIDLMQARAATITDVLPALLEQLAALRQDDDAATPGVTAAIDATRTGIAVLRSSSGRLDAALRQMHAAGDRDGIHIDELTTAMDEVARVVTAIQDAVNGVPQITLNAMRDLSARPNRSDSPHRGSDPAVQEQILAQVQEMAAAAGGLQSALKQATHGLGLLAGLRA
jgi:methyl-accepting chemotaxis protein